MLRFPATMLFAWLLSLSIHAQTYNILQYGAVGDSNTLNTVSIQRAIDLCAQTGGTVLIPRGIFITGTLYLKSGVTLYIEEGGKLLGSPFFIDYPDNLVAYKTVFTHHADGSQRFNKALLFAEGAHNIFLTGKGTIDGNGKSPEFMLGNDDAADTGSRRPCTILFINCENVELNDLHLVNSAYWMQNYIGCNGLRLKRLWIYDHANWNNDGVDIDARNVLVEDCTLDVDGDGICMKSHERDHFVENVIIRSCTIASNCNAIRFGAISLGGAKNISISDCYIGRASEENFHHWQQHLQFIQEEVTARTGVAIESVDGGVVDQVTISRMNIRGVQTPLFIVLGNRGRKAIGEKEGRIGQISNITFEHSRAISFSKMISAISGMPGHDIENVIIRDDTINNWGTGTKSDAKIKLPERERADPENNMYGEVFPASQLYIRHARNVLVENSVFALREEDYRPGILLVDVKKADLLTLEVTRLLEDRPIIDSVDSKDIVIKDLF